MKKSCSAVFLIAFVLSLIVSAQTSNAVVIFKDDFQSDPATLSGSAGDFNPVIGAGDIGGEWLVREDDGGGNTYLQVVKDNPPWSGSAGSNNYVSIARGESGSYRGRMAATGWDPEPLRNKIVEVNCSVYIPSGNSSPAGIGSWESYGWGFEGRGFDIYFWQDGYVYSYDGGDVWPIPEDQRLFAYAPDTWMNMTIIADMSAAHFSLTVDGNTVDNLPWISGANTVGTLMFAPDYNYTKFGIDNVKIETYSSGPKVPGDANRDQFVNEVDAAILAEYWLTMSDATWDMGDFNEDGKVDDADAAMMAANWGWTQGAGASVPEPSGLALIFVMGLASTAYVIKRTR